MKGVLGKLTCTNGSPIWQTIPLGNFILQSTRWSFWSRSREAYGWWFHNEKMWNRHKKHSKVFYWDPERQVFTATRVNQTIAVWLETCCGLFRYSRQKHRSGKYKITGPSLKPVWERDWTVGGTHTYARKGQRAACRMRTTNCSLSLSILLFKIDFCANQSLDVHESHELP